MREIKAQEITEAIAGLCIEANRVLPESLEGLIRGARETSPVSGPVMEDLCRNLDAARELGLPICQDTGMAVVFAELGQDVHITGGLLSDAVNEGWPGAMWRAACASRWWRTPCAG